MVWAGLGVGVVALVLVIAMLKSWRISQEEVRERIVATIQSEARQSFLVTGSLDVTATTTFESTKTFLPGVLNLDMGTSRATVQVPGRAFYGFDVRAISAKDIELRGDTVLMTVPKPRLLSVDANLQELKIMTDKGWLRTPNSVDAVERSALRHIDSALANQAAAHVANSAQPLVNSARALEEMLRPPLAAAGLKTPVFRFRMGQDLQLDR
jgi:hypothetical protein